MGSITETLMANFSLISASLVIPLLLILISYYVRNKANAPSSSPADLYLTLIVYNINVCIFHTDFARIISAEIIKTLVIPIHIAFAIIGLLAWVVSIFEIEAKMEIIPKHPLNLGQHYNLAAVETVRPIVGFVLAWTIAIVFLILHIGVLLGRIQQ